MYSETNYDYQLGIAAAFGEKIQAEQVAFELRREGFREVWIGHITAVHESEHSPVTGKIEFDNVQASADDWFQRVFGQSRKTLHDVLMDRGFAYDREGPTPLGTTHWSILTLYGGDRAELAAEIIRNGGGRLLRSASTLPSISGTYELTPEPA